MKILKVFNKYKNYYIFIDFGIIDFPDIFSLLKTGDYAMIVTNDVLCDSYSKKIKKNLLNKGVITNEIILMDGEKYKTLNTVNIIITELLKKQYPKNTTLIAVGGGVIGDLTGFAASCYQRGASVIHVPTTLLSQVDSCIGGKTGVNHPLGKNMIGTFYQPTLVIIDLNCLYTLPLRHFSSGLAEVIKYSIIMDYNFFCWLENNMLSLLKFDKKALLYCVFYCCKLKTKICSADLEETNGIRILLNLGHTFGHAIETEYGYSNAWLHGEAIAVGIVMATKTAELIGCISVHDKNRIIKLIQLAGLPINGPEHMIAENYLLHMMKDKKKTNKHINLILPKSIGQVKLYNNIDINIIVKAINSVTCSV